MIKLYWSKCTFSFSTSLVRKSLRYVNTEKKHKTVNSITGKKNKKIVKWLQIYVTLNPSHRQLFTWRPMCYSNDRSFPVMTEFPDWDSADPTAPRALQTNVQLVKLSLKRTVWGVVTSATASSCPSDRPSSAAKQMKDEHTHTGSWLSASSGSHVWSEDRWSPFKVLQRFGLVRSSMDLTDWKINAKWLEEYQVKDEKWICAIIVCSKINIFICGL